MSLVKIATGVVIATAPFLMAPPTPKSAQPATTKQTLTLGLQGYSPVSYVENHRADPGSPRFSAEHDGVTYFFVNGPQRDRFLADPERFIPAYGGYCAFGCAVEGLFTPDPTSFKVVEGRTYLFLKNDSIDTKMLWEKENPDEVRRKADAFWASRLRSRAYVGARNVPASGVALDGYSPVSYFTAGRAERGDPAFQAEHEGVTYYLTSAAQVEAFRKSPERYVPAFGGWCAFGMSVEDKFPVDPTSFRIVNDRLLLFLKNENVDAKALWDAGDAASLLPKAEAHWAKVQS
ncbi:MAG TPA: YHS domain-containing (seleno)protein [Phycisphaerae bacterium]|nr:YHS domain-containing (seleno)protein [Phycisphaerae bacterium]